MLKRFNSFISMAEDEFFDRGEAITLIKKHIENFSENKEVFIYISIITFYGRFKVIKCYNPVHSRYLA